ncbi:MAG: TonB-dependent receptor [Gammaproteobacteria bacterium]|nr:TonB-dependent receptor [Gammaproteobacteria bacterium]
MLLLIPKIFARPFLLNLALTFRVVAEDFTAALDEKILFEDIPSVYSASRYEQPVTQAPSSVSIVTSEDIKKFGYRNLGDIVGSMRGMYTSNDRIYQRIGIRGFNRSGDYNTRVLVLIDGHRSNDNLVDFSAIGSEFMVDVDDISRVELVRGPASSLYGSNAFLGILNIITKRGRDLEGPSVTGVFGSQETYKGKFTYGQRFDNGSELYLSGSHFQSEGEDNLSVAGLGTARDMDKDRSERGFAKYTLGDFTLSGAYVSRSKRPPVPIVDTIFNDSRNRLDDDRAYADLLYEHYFDNGLEVMARTYYDFNAFDGYYAFVPDDLSRDVFRGQLWGNELKLSKAFGDHHVIVGGEYRYNFQQAMRSFERGSGEQFADVAIKRTIWGVYIQDDYRILDNLTLNAGVRYDRYEGIADALNPRAALIYQPFADTTLKLLYGQSFRVPSAFEENYRFGNIWVGSSDLEPETMRSYELNLIQRIQRNYLLTLAPYFNQEFDMIRLTGGGTVGDPYIYKNVNSIETYGIETELQGQWESGWRAAFSYAYQQSRVQGDPGKPENSPEHLTKLNITGPLWQDLVFAGFNLSYTSRRNTFSSDVPGYFLANMTVFSSNLIPGLELSGSIYNLFDSRYHDPSTTDLRAETIEQNGRLFLVKFNYEF